MWTPSCARCCWRRRSSINRRRVRVHGPPPNGCRQHAEAAAARKLRAAPILPAVREEVAAVGQQLLPLTGHSRRRPSRRRPLRRRPSRRHPSRRHPSRRHPLCRCRRWLPSLPPLWRPCPPQLRKPRCAAPRGSLGLSKASAAVYDAIKQATREASSTKCDFDFCVRFAEIRIQCHNLVCKVFCQNSDFRFQVCVWRARVE